MNPEYKDDGSVFEKKRLAKPFSVKSADAAGTIDGYGSVFDAPHPTSSWALDPEWNDVIRPGAFADSLKSFGKLGTRPSMLYMHQRGNVIGAWQNVAEDKDGLALKGQVALSAKTPSDVPIYELLKMGAINGLSIGFRVLKSTLDEDLKLREILSVDLGEISIVDSPGDPLARVTDVKRRDPRFFEQLLREAGLSRDEAKAFIAKGLGALREAAANDEPTQREADRGGGSAWLKSIVDRAAKLKT
jgi:HK97 family phage prohead protease